MSQVTVTPANQSTTLALTLPDKGAKVARKTAKEFKASLPDTMTPKQKRAAYDEYTAQFSTAGNMAIAAIQSTHDVKLVKGTKSGGFNVVYTPKKTVSVSSVTRLKAENDAMAAELAALKAKLAAAAPAPVTA